MIIENAQELLAELNRNGFWGIVEFSFKRGDLISFKVVQTFSQSSNDQQGVVVVITEKDRIELRENYPEVRAR